MSHIHEKIDFTVEVFIVYQNKILLRKHDKYKMWLSVGGHIELDEDPPHAAIREVKEEVGLDIVLYKGPSIQSFNFDNYTELVPPMYLNRHRVNLTHEHVTLVYFAKACTDNLILSLTEKSDDCKWFTQKELEENTEIKYDIKFYALKALEILKD
jgi:8-oxo-dGTP pyrophosphatase MutT (NUDIX family)